MEKGEAFYTKKEEYFNAISHGAGLLFGLICGISLIDKVSFYDDILWQWSIYLYVFGLFISYFSSTVYHALPLSVLKDRFRKLDHAAIYLHISGSYSPVCLIALNGYPSWCWGLFLLSWLCALVGVCLSLRHISKHSHVETLCFIAMGCMVLFALKPLSDSVDPSVLWWILSEGFCYVAGAACYSLHGIRFMHGVFHVFVLMGTACHMFAVWQML